MHAPHNKETTGGRTALTYRTGTSKQASSTHGGRETKRERRQSKERKKGRKREREEGRRAVSRRRKERLIHPFSPHPPLFLPLSTQLKTLSLIPSATSDRTDFHSEVSTTAVTASHVVARAGPPVLSELLSSHAGPRVRVVASSRAPTRIAALSACASSAAAAAGEGKVGTPRAGAATGPTTDSGRADGSLTRAATCACQSQSRPAPEAPRGAAGGAGTPHGGGAATGDAGRSVATPVGVLGSESTSCVAQPAAAGVAAVRGGTKLGGTEGATSPAHVPPAAHGGATGGARVGPMASSGLSGGGGAERAAPCAGRGGASTEGSPIIPITPSAS
mmetsp:Transcript_35359/g.69780  ORF Transcript_35359/g.69780 Transcript_35359/m.69780 type:complete len:333 (-) Transcript_35359:243-1241(-)